MSEKRTKSRRKQHVAPKGWLVLPLSISPASTVARCLYVKRHVTSGGDAGGDSLPTLFVANIPCDFDYQNVMNVFSLYGEVESVVFLEEPMPGAASGRARCARVSFEDEESLRRVLELETANLRAPYEPPRLATGMKKWLLTYRYARPDVRKLLFQVDGFMEAFDERTEKERKGLEEEDVDEEGFTLVKYKKRKMRGAGIDALTGEAKEGGPSRKRKKSKEPLVHFYKTQRREKQKEKIALLRAKFEQDRQRIADMRAARKFKPY